mgnify:CR=1 FL=1|jgi:tRNA pseudouridine55 synthase
MYNGIINVYKESGFTSFDVVAKLRGILKQKKIGHTGTLDPDAEGVLVVCLGKATRLCDILTDKDKSYTATLLLGRTTDTEDSSGKLLTENDVNVTEEEVTNAIRSFVGEYDQIPPMYSAIKVNGKKLYELAREGIEIERTPRRVAIHKIDIISMELPYVTFRVSCGKGTYIRSLCRDIGEKLGCGGIMDKLVRDSVNATETGKIFSLQDSLTLKQIEAMVENGQFEQCIIPVDQMFPKLAGYRVNENGNKKLYNGNLLVSKDFTAEYMKEEDGKKCLVYDKDGQFAAVYQYHERLGAWKADKMFI